MRKTLEGRFESSSPGETLDLARRLAAELGPGSVVALEGPLGAGKTLFVKGLAEGLGLPPSRAVSPTFTLVNEYGGDPPLVHVDLYRLRGIEEIADLGLEEYFNAGGVVAVEWAEKAPSLFPRGTVTVRFERPSPGRRVITVSRPG